MHLVVSYQGSMSEGANQNEASKARAFKDLALLAAGDTLTLLLGYGINNGVAPVFVNRPVSWSVKCKTLGRAGLTHAFELDKQVWREDLARQFKSIPFPTSHRWGVFIYNGSNNAEGTLNCMSAKKFEAYVIDLDWTEKLGQTIVLEKQEAEHQKLEESNPLKQFWLSTLRHIKKDRSLPIVFDLDQLIRQGRAARITGIPNADRKSKIVDTITLTRHASSGRFLEDSIEPSSELRKLIARNMEHCTEEEKAMLHWNKGQKTLKMLQDALAVNKANEAVSKTVESTEDEQSPQEVEEAVDEVGQMTPSSVADSARGTEVFELNPRGERLFKLLEERWFHSPEHGKELGAIQYIADTEAQAVNLLSAKAEEQDRLAVYSESAKERAFWCLTEILCSVMVNVIFGILH